MVLCTCDSTGDVSLDPAEPQAEQLAGMEHAVHQLLLGVGEDPAREGLVDTPRRVAKAWLDMTRGYRQECTSAFGTALFHEPIVSSGGNGSGGLVVVRDITFAVLSEQTLLPFHGRCHIAYVPAKGVVLGLSKLARVTKCLAARLQTQQRFAERLAAAVQAAVGAAGVAAVVQAHHLGGGAAPTPLLTSAATGCFCSSNNGGAPAPPLIEFLTLLRLAGAPVPAAAGFCEATATELAASAAAAAAAPLCEGLPTTAAGADDEEGVPISGVMVEAANALLQSVGEDPSREGLKGGAARYVGWLQSATAGYRMRLDQCGSSSSSSNVGGSIPGRTPVAMVALAAAEPRGPPTPDDHSPDPSDAASDDMSADAAPSCECCCGGSADAGLMEAAAAAAAATEAGCSHSSGGGVQQQQGQQGGGAAASTAVETFSSQFSSQCEHHLLPFYGRLKIAYLSPAPPPPTASAAIQEQQQESETEQRWRRQQQQLAHIVTMYSRRLQVQERLTHQVADAVAACLGAPAVLVVVESAHMCMVARGVEKHASTTLTTAVRGGWAADPAARAAALGALLERQPQRWR